MTQKCTRLTEKQRKELIDSIDLLDPWDLVGLASSALGTLAVRCNNPIQGASLMVSSKSVSNLFDHVDMFSDDLELIRKLCAKVEAENDLAEHDSNRSA